MVATESAGFLIYEGVMPLIKTYITIFLGYIIARMGLFPPAASRGSSQVSMNVALPCLIFANIVPAFTPSNISAVGPLMLLAVIYIAVGFASGFIIREICFVPRNFWQGILICTGMSNWGNLPTSIVQSVTLHKPFNGDSDVELGVSYVSIFIMVYHIVFWVFGAAASIRWDFLPDVPRGDEAQRRVAWHEKPIGSLIHRYVVDRKRSQLLTRLKWYPRKHDHDDEEKFDEEAQARAAGRTNGVIEESVDPDIQLARRVSRLSAAPSHVSHSRHHNIPASNVNPESSAAPPPSLASRTSSETTLPLTQQEHMRPTSAARWERLCPAWFVRAVRPLGVIITPVTIALAISLPVSVIQPLKALFTDATASGGPDWHGPDGSPPLNFIMETASFVGGLCIPLSLIILGASFARMNIPKNISSLPIPAMILVTLSKEVMVPVVGIFLTQAFVTKGLIPKDALAQRFVAIFLSGTPTAVNQLVVASLYAPEGGTDTLTAFLVVQYTFMFISSTALTAVALLLL